MQYKDLKYSENNCQPRIIYPIKIPLKNCRKYNFQTFRDFATGRPPIQEMLTDMYSRPKNIRAKKMINMWE